MSPQVLAKSLQISRLRAGLVAAVATVVALNSTLLLTMVGEGGVVPVLGIMFFSIFLPILLLFRDISKHSDNAFDVFEALGARRRRLMSYLVLALALIGLGGAFLGAVLGMATSYLLQIVWLNPLISSIPDLATGFAVLTGYVGLVSALGIALGVTLGGTPLWRRG